ncbi:hypothetical protein CgunFtcFv8_019280 [Champsocephalus gunnari]|uniref:Uncharacterized protein n=1 Tax=Champsocephalus gunnari TaxID=52237 RepID=A0AAN8HS02_CHAGU|nr:hypothetical protein CgunFtcFv8_019280 [Champsocephalus gunnari]
MNKKRDMATLKDFKLRILSPCGPDKGPDEDRLSCVYDNEFLEDMKKKQPELNSTTITKWLTDEKAKYSHKQRCSD